MRSTSSRRTERGLELVGALFPWYIHQGKVYNPVALAQLCKAFKPVECANLGARSLCSLSREFSQIFFTLSRKTLWEGTIHLERFKDSPGEEPP
jgi:hypothetical protein